MRCSVRLLTSMENEDKLVGQSPALKADGTKPKVEQLKKDIYALSAQLKKLGEEKETRYKEKEGVEKKLNTLIQRAKDIRERKLDIDRNISKLKKEREELNSETKLMFSKFNQLKRNILNSQKPGSRPQEKVSSPAEIKERIEAIKYSIETEGLSFEREQRYMDSIRRLQQKLDDINLEEEKNKQLRDFKKKILEKKSRADHIHTNIQKIAKESSAIFEELTQLSGHISKSREKKSSLQATLKDLKSQIDELNQKLGEILKEWSTVTSESLAWEARESAAAIAQRTQQIMEKLKAKKKLTKEDILLMQRRQGKENR